MFQSRDRLKKKSGNKEALYPDRVAVLGVSDAANNLGTREQGLNR
jgi:hypothetical protein